MAITAKEAQFYSEAKAKGFADEDIANEIRSRRSAAEPSPYKPTDYAQTNKAGPSTDASLASTAAAKTPEELQSESAARLEGGTGTHEDYRATHAGNDIPGNERDTNEETARGFATFGVGMAGGSLLGPIAGKVMQSAPGRVAGRWLDEAATGAGKKARESLGEVADKAKDFITRNPAVMKAKNPAELREALRGISESTKSAREVPFKAADDASEVVARPKLAPLESQGPKPSAEPVGDFDAIGTNLSGRAELPTNVGGRVATADTQAAPEMIVGKGAGAQVESVLSKWDAKVARLSVGTNTEKQIAEAIKAEKARFMEGRNSSDAIPSSELRRHASDFQAAYDKTATNAANTAKKEMSKDTLDALREHVKDPALMKEIDSLTDDLSVITRLDKVAKQKVAADAAPGKPVKSEPHKTIVQRVKEIPGAVAGSIARPSDKILAKLAYSGVTGKDTSSLVEQALKLGATQQEIDRTLEQSAP